MPLLLILGITLWRLWAAATVPVTQDEAYYFHWAQALAWGYFDHPPGVAVLGLGSRLAPASALAARLGAILAGLLTLLVLWRFYVALGLRRGQGLLALVLAAGTAPGLIAGVITTPDTALMLCWALALHEALPALRGARRRWLTAGVATGLGLLGKYSMAVIGPVFLWAMLAADRRALATPWPYLGGLLAFLVFLPHLLWNAEHDWLSLRFQLGHGLATELGSFDVAADGLPGAVGSQSYTPPGTDPVTPLGRLGQLATFIGSQLGFWGLLLLPLAIALGMRSGLRRAARELAAALDRPARALLLAGTAFPLGLFGLLSLTSDVEANWSALYLACAVPAAAVLLRPLSRWALLAAAGNLLLVSLYVVHAATAALPVPDAAQRILRESYGYPALAAYAETLEAPVFADRYPFAAMLNFHAPGLAVPQWPNIARPSEYSRGRLVPPPPLAALQHTGFWLVAYKFSPPEIPGFQAAETRSLFQCPRAPLKVVQGGAVWAAAGCEHPVQGWRLYRYVADTPAQDAPTTPTQR